MMAYERLTNKGAGMVLKRAMQPTEMAVALQRAEDTVEVLLQEITSLKRKINEKDNTWCSMRWQIILF